MSSPMLSSASSPPPSPLQPRFALHSSPQRSMTSLRFPDVANIFIRMRRAEVKPAKPTKPHSIKSMSGDAPTTHSTLLSVSERKIPLSQEDRFVCRGGVDVAKLLRAIRGSLHDKAGKLGANVLVDEKWECSISAPRRDSTYRVVVRYAASAARCSCADPQKPVALENAKGVPGLMSIIDRLE